MATEKYRVVWANIYRHLGQEFGPKHLLEVPPTDHAYGELTERADWHLTREEAFERVAEDNQEIIDQGDQGHKWENVCDWAFAVRYEDMPDVPMLSGIHFGPDSMYRPDTARRRDRYTDEEWPGRYPPHAADEGIEDMTVLRRLVVVKPTPAEIEKYGGRQVAETAA